MTQNLIAGTADAPQKCVVGRDNLAFRIKDDNPVVDAVNHGFQPFPLGVDFAHQSGHRVSHDIKLTSQPGQRVRPFHGRALLQVALRNQARRHL